MIVCLAGMGRSGTSLMASYFRHCGISMGDRLLGARFNNPRGHFEDQDFLDFHKELLVQNRSNMYSPRNKMIISGEMLNKAKNIIASRSEFGKSWGWKEPRTSLFLDMWGELLPDAKFVFMYRDAYANMESLYRIIHKRYIYLTPWVVPKAWIHYNECCIAFHENNPGRSVFVSIEGFNSSHDQSSEVLGNWLGYEFNCPYTDVYRPKEMGCEKTPSKPFPIYIYLPVIKQVYGDKIDTLTKRINSIALIRRETDKH
jgi:hypothetical protein